MMTVIVGHRGTGKSELVRRLGFYAREEDIEFVDLDDEIEQKIGKTIRELFMEHGEAYFREVERQVFLENMQKPHKQLFMVVGAGFDLKVLPSSVRVLWLRRRTDMDGRIFLNRPRLQPELPPLEEFQNRGILRERSYREAADEIYLMPDGMFENKHRAMSVEKAILLHQLEKVGGGITILPSLFGKENRWELFCSRFQGRGVDFFELRNDLLDEEQMNRILKDLKGEKFLFSFRRETPASSSILEAVQWLDWALELGEPPSFIKDHGKDKIVIISFHGQDSQIFEQYKDIADHFKFSPSVDFFPSLIAGHRWQAQDPGRRSFLPRSAEGDFIWYRLLQKGRQRVNFWKEGEGSALDQPSLFQWLITPDKPERFAAVLGDPVYHSFTPLEQSEYFHKKSVPVLAIRLRREEWMTAMPFLQELGLRWAAVTSPHKEAAAILAKSDLKALNTLYFSEKKGEWSGAMTDNEGFVELIEGVGMIAPLQKEIFIWGGGGTLAMIEQALPHATFFSSRTGKSRGIEEKSLFPKVLIWAAPRTSETQWPPESWSPAMVLDLNYKEDSMGREYAQRCGAHYTSGLGMFLAQARGQRVFWSRCEEEE